MKKFVISLVMIMTLILSVTPVKAVSVSILGSRLNRQDTTNSLPEGCKKEGVIDSWFTDKHFLDSIYKSLGYESIFLNGGYPYITPFTYIRTNLEGITSNDLLKIKTLSLSYVSNLKRIDCMVNLESYTSSYGSTSNYAYFSQSKKLKNISIFFSSDQNTDGLLTINSLESFEIGFSSVSDLSGLKNNLNMKKINLGFVQVSDISVLANFENLTHIELRSTPVSDISVLQNLKHLEEIKIIGTKVSDLSPLVNNPHISENTTVYLRKPQYIANLDSETLTKYLESIETLESRGVTVHLVN